MLAGLAAYANSFRGVLVFDDESGIVHNRSIEQLWPLSKSLSPPRDAAAVGGRPLLNFSLALNYALDGRNPRGYHAANLAIHLLAALLLFGILRRTLELPALKAHLGDVALPLSLAATLLWTVHPLQTESVTYVIQRAESMMGLFCLATLYCVIRGDASRRHGGWWNALAVAACCAGMATKEVMVSAPLVVASYDRLFLSRSWKEVFRRRWDLYLGLGASWLLLACLVWTTGLLSQAKKPDEPTWWAYFRTQPGVVLHYLRLSFWPRPLCLDYAWLLANSWREAAAGVMVLGALAAATVWGYVRSRPGSFLGVWFFLILAPTSSILPLYDPAFEHRMYLPLAAVTTAVVIVGFVAWRAVVSHGWLSQSAAKFLAACIFCVVVVALGALTFERNNDYSSSIRIWQQTASAAPKNPRAQGNLGNALQGDGQIAAAVACFRRSLELMPDCAEVHHNLGNALAALGQTQEAIDSYRQAIRLEPDYASAHSSLGNSLFSLGRVSEAAESYRRAIRAVPSFAAAHNNLGNALFSLGEISQATESYREATRLDPEYAAAYSNLGNALSTLGRMTEAEECCRQAIRLDPNNAEAHSNLGNALSGLGRFDEAIAEYEKALRIQPEWSQLRFNLGNALEHQGRVAEAVAHWRRGVRSLPNEAAMLNRFAWTLATNPAAAVRNGADAIRYAQQACSLLGNQNPAALDTLAAAYAEAGRFPEALQTAQQALDLAKAQTNAALAETVNGRLQLYQSGKPFRDTRTPSGSSATNADAKEEPAPPGPRP